MLTIAHSSIFMEPLRISLFPLLLLLHLSSLSFSSAAYTVPQKYFINCGSGHNITLNNRVFVGDLNGDFYFPKDSFPAMENGVSSTSENYVNQTARISQNQFSYKFSITDQGYHLVRLHFFAFSSSSHSLSRARFNVSVPNFLLIANLNADNCSRLTLVKEFYLNISKSSFQIDFRPFDEASLAFVNAIELFRLPDHFVPSKAPYVSSKGNNSDYKSILSWVLLTSFRLNVGNSTIDQDNLWRKWEEDDQYAKNGTQVSKDIQLKYQGDDTENYGLQYIAPDPVYLTARVMNGNDSSDDNAELFNITWGFPVKRKTIYFVRAHFCDIISKNLNLTFFYLYIYNNFRWSINSLNVGLAVPFYYDFVVDSGEFEVMNITIGPDNSPIKNTFLNGLEVMEIINTTGPPSIDGPDQPKHHHVSRPLVLGLVFGALLLVLICIMVGFFFLRKSWKPKFIEHLDWSPLPAKGGGGGSSHGKRGSSHGSSVGNLNLGLKITFHEIQSATKNFNTKRIIGKGGFGNVYKGILKNGMRVAVKRRNPGSGQGLPEFETEIMVLSRIRHRHLVSLIGYCDERSEMILVYEYMEKGTLRDHLYNSNLPSLSWKHRLEICIGAARGLNYLHKGAAGGIIHRDVKSTNILLDENLIAKVADFGLSRTGPMDQHSYVSTGVKGTLGYLDPEYFRSEQLTEKSDVYSFGVVLLEVLCARPAIDQKLPTEQINLAEWCVFCMNKGTIEETIDPSIKGQILPNSLRKFSQTVEKCLKEDACERPTMSDVLWDLEYSLQLQRGATPKSLHVQEDSSSGASDSASLQLSNVRRLPSLSTLGETDDMPILKIDDSDNSAMGSVFSQMKIDGGR